MPGHGRVIMLSGHVTSVFCKDKNGSGGWGRGSREGRRWGDSAVSRCI